jgi:hypothetical protein
MCIAGIDLPTSRRKPGQGPHTTTTRAIYDAKKKIWASKKLGSFEAARAALRWARAWVLAH